jgi:hypothetical protein
MITVTSVNDTALWVVALCVTWQIGSDGSEEPAATSLPLLP